MTISTARRIARALWPIGQGIIVGGAVAVFGLPSWVNLAVGMLLFVIAMILESIRCDETAADT